MERVFKGVWIPKEIWLNENLSIQEKVFIAEIDSLDNDEGCFASNDYFSKFFKLSKNRCSEIIKSLEKKKIITISYICKENSKAIEKRVIKVVNKPIRYSQKGIRDSDRPIRDSDRPTRDSDSMYSENCEDNNIFISNPISNPSSTKKKKTSSLDEIINNYTSNLDLKETLQDFLKMRKAQKKVMTDRALKTLLNKLDTLATTDEEKIERLEESICNCWLTVYPKKDLSNKNYKQESLDAKANKNYENLKKIMKEQQEHYEENVAKYMADCEEVPF